MGSLLPFNARLSKRKRETKNKDALLLGASLFLNMISKSTRLVRLWRPWLRRWDVATARRVDHFIACSMTVARRIERQPADADIGGHQPLPGEHLEQPQNVLAFAEA